MYDASFAGHPVRVVVDSFASHNFMALKTAKQFGLDVENTEGVDVELGDKTLKPVAGKTTAVLSIRGFLSTEMLFSSTWELKRVYQSSFLGGHG